MELGEVRTTKTGLKTNSKEIPGKQTNKPNQNETKQTKKQRNGWGTNLFLNLEAVGTMYPFSHQGIGRRNPNSQKTQ